MPPLRFARSLALLLVVLTAAACFRGGKKSREKKEKDTATAAASAEVDSLADPAWLEGRLPASVLEGTPRMGGTLVVRLQSEPPSLNKIVDSDLITSWMLERKVLEGMAELDASKHPEYPLKPALAEGWEVSEDGLTFTFRIRRGVKWHDGKPFSGKDVVATVEKILDPKVRAMHLRSYLEDLESISTAPGDDFTVIAKYRRPYFMAFRFLATLAIYPKHILDEAGDMMSHPVHRAPVGTGPFRFVEWDTLNKRIVFERNEDYWGRKAYLDRVIYRLVADATVAVQLLQQGEFDVFTRSPPQAWAREMPASRFLIENYNRSRFYESNYSWIGWNIERPYFKDPRVRLAMTLLIDREGARQRFLLGLDRPTTCHFYLESDNCDPDLQPHPYDPARAARLLDEAGWVDTDGDGIRDKDGIPFRPTFLVTASSDFLQRLSSYMQREFRKVGLELEVKRVQWSLFTQMLRTKEFDICSLAWGSRDVVSDPYQIWHSSQAAEGSNYIGYSNPRVDELIEQARAELDDSKRAALYRQFGRIIYDENPYTFLYNRPALDLFRKNVRGIRPAIPWYDLEDVWLADAPGPEVTAETAAP